ncbi:E3 ubiquitin-protein ligase TRIM7-like [Sceloporus undulatus]|uniref:E3 ubiquitin-protein ligase TRIM7-like n=1 Tax=Sceloporus undulatus TaxID=8520 RepID=UPI001C4B633B|nr:E3 ubiquitin-protein ligase TRIM7-like [Sceloporus undulatus]
MEEAAQLYKEKIECCVKILKEKRGKILSFISDSAKSSDALLQSKTKDWKQKLVCEFQQLYQALEKEEQLLLVQLDKLEGDVKKRKTEQANELSVEISHLDTLTGELEQKYRESPVGMLQDIGTTLKRCKRVRFELPALLDTAEVMKKLQEFFTESESLQKELKKFRETLTEPKWIKEDVLLDPVTAHPQFTVSEDFKSVRWGPVREELPYNDRRFDSVRCVLGSQGFSSGKHQWTVDVDRGTSWAVGVASNSVKRKDIFSLVPEEGIWAIGLYSGQYKVLTSPATILNLSKRVRKIRICLDCEGKTLAFFDAEENKCLCLFSIINFKSPIIHPFFRIGDINTILRLC